MRQCHSCGSLLSVHSPVCLSCGASESVVRDAEGIQIAVDDSQPLASNFSGKLVPVARFCNSAEAGYFADDLEHSAQIDAKLTVQEHFDALTGRWRHDYVLLVDESQAQRAAAHMSSQVDESAEDDHGIDPLEPLPDNMPALGLNWVPILLTTLAAGSIAYWGVKKVEERPRPPVLGDNHLPQRGDDLWTTVVNADGPWFQQIGDGPGMRVMRAEAAGRIIIQEDHDGDRKIDREYRLRR